MKRQHTLVVPETIAKELHRHMFPGDGLEAAALLLCTVSGQRRQRWLAREVIAVPHAACTRQRDSITWPGEYVESAIVRAAACGDAIIAVHSHPGGLYVFSNADDASDIIVMSALHHGTDRPAGSAIMIPSGAMRARLYEFGGGARPFDLVTTAGSDIRCWWLDQATTKGPPPSPMAFTSGMRAWLGRLSVCVIGVSGTGSMVAEQLARLGVGEIILIDFDKLEEGNLNRILNATLADIGSHKVEIFADAIRLYRADCDVISVPSSVATREAIRAASEADILFSCVDTAEGRHIADRLSAYFAMPLFDVGVAIPTEPAPDDGRRIVEVYGRVDYVYPSGSSLMDRGVYDASLLEAEYLARTAPKVFTDRIAEGYLRGLAEEAPGVISLNMRAASACVLEFIARLLPFRQFPNETRARSVFMLAEGDEDVFAETHFVAGNRFPLALGMTDPLLGLPALTDRRRVA
jgi:hypothetical protein